MTNSPTKNKKILTGGVMVLAVIASVHAQQQPFMQAGTAQPPPLPMPKAVATTNAVSTLNGTGTNAVASSLPDKLNKFFNGKIPDALANGKINVDVRARYEQVNDVFLTTPSDGLQDIYTYAQVTLPEQIPVRFVFHKYNAVYGGGNYGEEYDVVASKKFGKHWTVMANYAYYQGEDPAAPSLTAANVDIQKVWVSVEFKF